MSLKLSWKNPNTQPTTIDIYRGDTSTVDLTTPLVTVDGATTSWIDTTALFGKTYYYVWAVNSAKDRVVSRPQKIEVADRRGPGPNTLVYGNELYGYFGSVPTADFVNSAAITGALKSLTGIDTTVYYPKWYKYSRNGKVLFVPDTRFGDATWQNLYNAGAVFGTNDVGAANPPGTVNQLCTFELNGDLFLIRLPKGYPDGLTWDGTGSGSMDALAAVKEKYSEYEDLFFPIMAITPLRQRMVNVDGISGALILTGGNYTDRASVGVACQEQSPTNNGITLMRGVGGNSYNPPDRNTASAYNVKAKTTPCCWWPVIEYIGRVGGTVTLPLTAK